MQAGMKQQQCNGPKEQGLLKPAWTWSGRHMVGGRPPPLAINALTISNRTLGPFPTPATLSSRFLYG